MENRWQEPFQRDVISIPDVVNVHLLTTTAKAVAVPAGANYVSMLANTAPVWISYAALAEYNVLVGDFASDTVWTKGGTWTISAGVATRTASGSGLDISQSLSGLIATKPYSVTFTVTAFTAGTVTPVLGGTLGTARGSAATFTETIIAGSANLLIAFRADAAAALSIDNVSVDPVAVNPGADVTNGSGSELIPGGTGVNPVERQISGITRISLVADSATPKITMAYYK